MEKTEKHKAIDTETCEVDIKQDIIDAMALEAYKKYTGKSKFVTTDYFDRNLLLSKELAKSILLGYEFVNNTIVLPRIPIKYQAPIPNEMQEIVAKYVHFIKELEKVTIDHDIIYKGFYNYVVNCQKWTNSPGADKIVVDTILESDPILPSHVVPTCVTGKIGFELSINKNDHICHIVNFDYDEIELINPFENEVLLIQALGVSTVLSTHCTPDMRWILHIAQPRLDHYASWTITHLELWDKWDKYFQDKKKQEFET